MSHKTLVVKIEQLLAEPLEDLGYKLIAVEVLGKVDLTVQIFIEPLSGGYVTVEDCAIVSRHVSALMDVEDLIESAYVLEISSPGIDRVLKTKSDFETYLGFEVKVKIIERVDGRRNYRGRLIKVDGDHIVLRVDQEDHEVVFSNIEHAKLVLTDDLIEFTSSAAKTKH